jgi:AraC-like DNA-binding protein
MDVLSDVLSSMRLQGFVFAATELTAPWGMRADARPQFAFHIIARGQCWLRVDGQAARQVSAGDVVLLSPGVGHTLSDSPKSPAKRIEDMLADGAFSRPIAALSGGTQVVCGGFQFDDVRGELLLRALPLVIHANELGSEAGPWLAQIVRLLVYESGGTKPGSAMIMSRLCDALFVYAIRSAVAQLAEREANWLRALLVPQIATALQLIHDQPERDWTLAALAARAAMSRTVFAERFANVVGHTPMQYLARWRHQKAVDLLRGSDLSVAEVASRVGYESEAAFNKAFKRSMGATPGAFRKAS